MRVWGPGDLDPLLACRRVSSSPIGCPSANDPARNQHRCGIAWSMSAVRVIITNPRYTGRQG